MATIRKLRGRWQAQVRRRGMKPRCKSFDSKSEAEKWARELESHVDKFGAAPDTRSRNSHPFSLLMQFHAFDLVGTPAPQVINPIKFTALLWSVLTSQGVDNNAER